MAYIDGFVLPVPRDNKEAYLALAKEVSTIFREFGALNVMECWGTDVPDGEVTSFPMAVKYAEDETVVFSWITWPSREARDAGHAKFTADPRMEKMMGAMPFDGKRMIFGGFEVILDA
jgi:uncharacterized protein YbaA (DUF1428 family)